MEGHPDNVAPAILGDFVVASHVETKSTMSNITFQCVMSLHLFQRNHYLPKKSRCFARKLTYKEAVAASSIANVMIAAILNGIYL